MALLDQIQSDMKHAMKTQDSATLSTLRLLRSALKNKRIDLGRELTEEDIQAVLKSEVKKLKDSLGAFEDAGRPDKASAAKREIAVLETYLPEQLSDAELESIVSEVIDETGVGSKADFGQVMGMAMQRVKNRADGSRVRKMVERLLAVFVLAVLLSVAPAAHAGAFGLGDETLIEWVLRGSRVLFMVAGIVSINLILRGGFKYMIFGRRHDGKQRALSHMTGGIMGTVVIAALFAVATVALQKM